MRENDPDAVAGNPRHTPFPQNKTMITLNLDTPELLHQHLPSLLPGIIDNLDDARTLHEALKDYYPFTIQEFADLATTYSTATEAFHELYPFDEDDFKREVCETYEACITDFSTHYTSWLEANCNPIYLTNKILIITE